MGGLKTSTEVWWDVSHVEGIVLNGLEKSGEKRRMKSGMDGYKSGIAQGVGYTWRICRGVWWFGR